MCWTTQMIRHREAAPMAGVVGGQIKNTKPGDTGRIKMMFWGVDWGNLLATVPKNQPRFQFQALTIHNLSGRRKEYEALELNVSRAAAYARNKRLFPVRTHDFRLVPVALVRVSDNADLSVL